MEEIFLTEHSWRCTDKTIENGMFEGFNSRKFCELNPEKFMFFLYNNFFIINYFSCLESSGHIEFKEALIKAVMKKTKVYEGKYTIERQNIGDDFYKYRKKNIPLPNYIKQYNYFYQSFHRNYAIVSEIKLKDGIIYNEILKENYLKAKEYLKNNNYYNFLDELENLYIYNYQNIDEYEIIKTNDELIKYLKNKK